VQRLATALVATVILLALVFLVPSRWFFGMAILVVEWAVLEYVGILRTALPRAPLRSLLVLVPLAAVALMLATAAPGAGVPPEYLESGHLRVLATALALTVVAGAVVLFGRTPIPEALPALGAVAFGLPYFALAALALGRLQAIDPWVLFLGFAVVFLGDTAAYYVGRRFGRRKLAPVVSPNKSWEGAAAGLVAGVLTAAVWAWWRLGEVSPAFLAVAVATAVAAQVGDLIESMLKRASGSRTPATPFPATAASSTAPTPPSSPCRCCCWGSG
jgi:phosphatidate cytidylyltransferase